MTSDGLQIVQFLFTQIWRFFTEWKIPGTDTTPGAFFMFLILAGIGLKFIISVFNTSPKVGIGDFFSSHTGKTDDFKKG